VSAAGTGDGGVVAALEARTEVAPDRIEAALAQRWRQLAEAAVSDRQGPPITRAFLWNLIVSGQAEVTRPLVDELANELPSRAIVFARPEEGDGKLRAYVETNVSGSGVHTVGSDEVTVEVGGPDAQAQAAILRVPSVIRSLLVPDALTALVWVGPPAPRDHVTRVFLRDVDRLILDSRRLPAVHSSGGDGELGLQEMLAIAERHPRLELADLAWLGISPLRGLLATLFDPPCDASPLYALDEVSVLSGVAGVQVRALLMLGWLGVRLGWSAPRQVRAERAGERCFLATRADGGEVRLVLSTDLSGVRHGVRRLELCAGGRRWSLDRDNEKIEVRSPNRPPHAHPVRSHTVAERLAEALGRKGRDEHYRPALGFAALLAGAVST